MERSFPFNVDLRDCLKLCPERPSLILQPETASPYLPSGLTEVDIPTACFQVDTYAYTQRRIAWSMLFDHVFVYHPGYDIKFRKSGHPGAHFIPHAVDTEPFAGEELERAFEVGWVGQIQGRLYRRRARLLTALSESFRMNDFARRHLFEEMATVYRQSKIVVNIGRDDFPQDANMRTIEVMASGALLITSLPSELTQMGFEEGIHFIGYRKEKEIQPLIRKYLNVDLTRKRIGNAAREKVLREYTYDQQVESVLRQVEAYDKKLLAPARAWPVERVRLAYLDYFAANGELKYAFKELQRITRLSLKETALGGSFLARAYARMVRRGLSACRDASQMK